MLYSCLYQRTPTEHYNINKHKIYVKRDDLFGKYPAPPLAKLRGASVLLEKLKQEGVERIGVFDTRISRAGRGVAYLCKELGLECEIGFPLLKGTEIPENQRIAELQLGAKLYPLKAGRTAVCYHQFKKHVEGNGGAMLPLGLVCKETVLAVKEETERTLKELEESGIKIKAIVVSTGTGTIATGIHLGSCSSQIKVIGVSCGMSIKEQYKRMRIMAFPENLNHEQLVLIPPEYDYYRALDTSNCPFPTSPYYDMKAYSWLQRNIERLEQPVLFYNIGV